MLRVNSLSRTSYIIKNVETSVQNDVRKTVEILTRRLGLFGYFFFQFVSMIIFYIIKKTVRRSDYETVAVHVRRRKKRRKNGLIHSLSRQLAAINCYNIICMYLYLYVFVVIITNGIYF